MRSAVSTGHAKAARVLLGALALVTSSCGPDPIEHDFGTGREIVPAECEALPRAGEPSLPAPRVELTGAKVVLLERGESFEDAGARATSASGIDLTERIQVLGDRVNTAEVGDFLVRYRVVDDAGTSSEAARIVRVIESGKLQPLTLHLFGATEAGVAYFEHLPENFGVDPDATYPLFLFNAGWGGDRQLDPHINDIRRGGVVQIIEDDEWDRSRPFVVLVPQRCETEITRGEMSRLEYFIEYAVETYRIDPSRIYMGGFSDGGWLTWNYLFMHPESLAGAVPMGAGGPIDTRCVVRTPVWAFQGSLDQPLSATFDTIDTINACALAERARLTIFTGAKHDHSFERLVLVPAGLGLGAEWRDAYVPDIYSWMSSHARR